MKAAAYDRYGPADVVTERELPEPSPRPGYARVRVRAAALNPKDVLVRKGKLRWLGRAGFPRIPGYDVAGELIDPADGLAPGAPVFGMIQSHRGGACAEVARLACDELAVKPAGIDMREAASLPLAALTALQALRDELLLAPGRSVLLNGASGGVGTAAVQIARAMGGRVTAVCSGKNAALVEELGAHAVIDYTRQDVTAARGLDAVFDIYGNLPYPAAAPMLAQSGRYCTTVPGPGAVARGVLRKLGLHRAALVVVRSNRADLQQLARWVDSGELKPVIDSSFALAESSEAHRRLETRRARGKIVVEI